MMASLGHLDVKPDDAIIFKMQLLTLQDENLSGAQASVQQGQQQRLVAESPGIVNAGGQQLRKLGVIQHLIFADGCLRLFNGVAQIMLEIFFGFEPVQKRA